MKNILVKFYRSYLWLFLFAFAGESGCSCTKVIETAERDFTIDGETIHVKADKVEFYDWATKEDEGFSIVFQIKVGDRPALSDAFYIPSGEEDHAQQKLDLFNAIFSNKKDHIAIGVEDQVFAVYHLLENGTPFGSNVSEKYKGETFSTLDLNKLARADEMVEAFFSKNQNYYDLSNQNRMRLRNTLEEQEAGGAYDQMALNYWPKSELSSVILTNSRIKSTAGTGFSKQAAQKSYDLIKDGKEMESAVAMLLATGEDKYILKTDELLFPEWPGNTGVMEYVDGRLATNYPRLDEGLVIKTQKTAQKLADGKLKKKHRVHDDMIYALRMFLKLKDDPYIKKCIEDVLSPKEIQRSSYKVYAATIDRYAEYTPEHQAFMVKRCRELIPSVSKTDKRKLFKFLVDKVDCDGLWSIMRGNYDALKGIDMPASCQQEVDSLQQ